MARSPGARDHGAGILLGPAGAVDDHIETTPLQELQTLRGAAVAHQVLQPGGHGLLAAGEQGQGMAGVLQQPQLRLAHEAGTAHHQDVHAETRGRDVKPAAIQTPCRL